MFKKKKQITDMMYLKNHSFYTLFSVIKIERVIGVLLFGIKL